jgi:hypothetical protein
MAGSPAQADSPEVFFGSAAGKALDLVVLDTEAAFGASQASADSTGAATASGAGALLPGVSVSTPTKDIATPTFVERQVADASKGDPDIKERHCASQDVTDGLPAEVKALVDVGIVCSAAEARKSGGPSAKGEASLAEVGLNAQFAIEQLDTVELGDTGAALLETICQTIADVDTSAAGDAQEDADNAKGEVCAATDTLADVITSVLQTSSVLDATVGKTTSSVTTEAGKVTSTATAAGATVKVLPLPELDALPSTDPLVTVGISQASATAVYDRGTGEATASFDPALVRLTLNPAVADQVSQLTGVDVPNEIVITSETLLNGVTVPVVEVPTTEESVGGTTIAAPACSDDPSSVCVPVGPLEVRIRVGNGRVVTNADGSVKAEADGVSVKVTLDKSMLTGPAAAAAADVPEQLASLAIAHAEAAVGGQAAKVTTSSVPDDNGNGPGNGGDPDLSRTLPPAELPRTGGTPWIPLVGATVLSLAVIGRRVAAKATR